MPVPVQEAISVFPKLRFLGEAVEAVDALLGPHPLLVSLISSTLNLLVARILTTGLFAPVLLMWLLIQPPISSFQLAKSGAQ